MLPPELLSLLLGQLGRRLVVVASRSFRPFEVVSDPCLDRLVRRSGTQGFPYYIPDALFELCFRCE